MSEKGSSFSANITPFFAVNGISDPYPNNHGLHLPKECGMIEKNMTAGEDML